MAGRVLEWFIRQLHRQVEREKTAHSTDRELLRRFVRDQEDFAFDTLFQRHGAMVYGVCRRLLKDPQDAEDAFQATFLVLIRKANSLMAPESVGGWLHGVARRAAQEVRRQRARTASREVPLPAEVLGATVDPAEARELKDLLDKAIAYLGSKYREAIVLCDMEGGSRQEVARLLGIPEKTLSSRLATARKKLAKRLAQRGVEVSAGALPIALADASAFAAVPLSLKTSLIQAAALLAKGQVLTAVASPSVVLLTQGVMKTMLLTRLSMVGAGLIALLLLATIGFGAGLLYEPPSEDPRLDAQVEKPANDKPQAVADDPLPAGNQPQPLPPEIVKFWLPFKNEVGWMNEFEYPEFRPGPGPAEPGPGKPGDVPAIRWGGRERKTPGLGQRPAPQQPFGLYCYGMSEEEFKDLVRFDQLRVLVVMLNVRTEDTRHLAKLKQLRVLSLGGGDIGDVALRELSEMKQLHSLYLWGTKITDAGLKDLSGMQQLQRLDVSGTMVTDAGMKELAKLKRLQQLTLGCRGIGDPGLKDLSGLVELRSLYLGGSGVSNAGTKALAEMEKLQALGLDSTRISDAGLKDIAGLKRLEALTMHDTPAGDAGLKGLAELNQLKTLNLGRTKVDDAGLKELRGLTKLEWLYLSSTAVTDAGMKELAGLINLRTVYLDSTAVTDAGLKELAALKQLETLFLIDAKVGGSGLTGLAGLKQLRELHLGKTPTSDADLKSLAGLANLETLNLAETKVTDMGLKDLAGLQHLKTLRLQGTKVTDAGLAVLGELKSLETLTLINTLVTQEGVQALRKARPRLDVAR